MLPLPAALHPEARQQGTSQGWVVLSGIGWLVLEQCLLLLERSLLSAFLSACPSLPEPPLLCVCFGCFGLGTTPVVLRAYSRWGWGRTTGNAGGQAHKASVLNCPLNLAVPLLQVLRSRKFAAFELITDV